MPELFNQNQFDRWQELRKPLNEHKRAKEHGQVVEVARMIISLDKEAKFIRIMTPLFYKEIGMAYEKLSETEKAIESYRQAVEGLVRYRESNDLNSPEDWLKDIQSLNKNIDRLQAKLK
ncbi:tetratricopeptide repeat protein [Halomonas sp. EF61]|uniref:tetratricopeptide repeat protein n=1 Tax=Halomonas sp. EF61 TaxID=2950869 RepID=UPI0032E043D0